MNSNNPWLSWKLWLPLAFQTALIIAVPAQSLYTLIAGKTVVFKTEPVDPYDFLRGYSQTLSYDISNISNLEKLPGGAGLKLTYQSDNNLEYKDIYVVLEAPKTSTNKVPQAWRAVKVSQDYPTLSPKQIAVKGKIQNRTVKYGLENYYMPESSREQINREITQATWGKNKQPIVVQAKVDSSGKAVIESFWIGERQYQF